jgi:BarA-like signal transduction histidine kinase
MIACFNSSLLALLDFFLIFSRNESSKRGVGGILGSTPLEIRYSSTIALIFYSGV